jgi:hypothetical protein
MSTRMNESCLLEHLEEIARRLGVELRYENLYHGVVRIEGGYCRVAGKPMILIDRRDSRDQKIRILCNSLTKLNLQGIFIPPAVRKVLEAHHH